MTDVDGEVQDESGDDGTIVALLTATSAATQELVVQEQQRYQQPRPTNTNPGNMKTASVNLHTLSKCCGRQLAGRQLREMEQLAWV